MADNIHTRAKELFLKARELPKSKQNQFIESEAKGNKKLVDATLELLAFDKEETILSMDSGQENQASDITIVDPLGLNKLSQHAKSNVWQRLIYTSKSRTGLAFLAIAILVGALGYLASRRVKAQLTQIRTDETRAILTSNVEALTYWIDDYQSVTRMAITDGLVKENIRFLLQDKQNQQVASAVDSLIKPYLDHADGMAYVVTDLNGVVIQSSSKYLIGQRLKEEFGSVIYSVAGGEYRFVLPFYPERNSDTSTIPRPLVWMQVPVKDGNGEVMATFGIGRYADTDFTEILRTAKIGRTGETYAIDKDGYFITESRFENDLRNRGMLDTDTNVSSIIHIQARKYDFEMSKDIRTLTNMAALVVASQESKAGFQMDVVSVPSEDYRGNQVIGAWAWLPHLDFGIITQMNVEEAFEPLKYLYGLMGVAILLLLLAAAYSFYNESQLVAVRGQLGTAIEMGKYQINKIIAQGGMGTVYLAQHQMLKRPTAIKVIRMDTETEDATKRFEREVKLASQLSHPNTIEIFDYGVSDGSKAYCAMEYLVGLNLKEVVQKSGGGLPAGRVVHILKQVCASLFEAHTLGLVHRDIKPQNIMLTNKVGLLDFVKVLDFGLAKPLSGNSNKEETTSITGTPVYLAPERLKRPGSAQPSSDIYAVGALAYYLLSGTPVFSFSSDLDVLYQILNEEPQALPAEVPADLARLTMFCLDKDPENRPADIGELKSFLDNLVDKYPWSDTEAEDWWNKHGN